MLCKPNKIVRSSKFYNPFINVIEERNLYKCFSHSQRVVIRMHVQFSYYKPILENLTQLEEYSDTINVFFRISFVDKFEFFPQKLERSSNHLTAELHRYL